MSFCLHSAIRRVSICIAVVAALMLPSAAYADDSGLLKVDLSSSAQSCVIGEEIELCAAVTNEGGADAYDVSYELALPESLVTDSGPGALDSIAPGETKELKFTARAVGSEVVGAVVDELDGSGGSPATGDSLIPVVAVLAAVLILAIFGVAAARNRGRHSALLGCLVLAIAVGAAVPVAAFADSVSRTAEGSTDIVVNGQNGTACLTVAYLTSGSQGGSGSDGSGSDSDADEPAEGVVLKPGVVEIQPEHWFVLSPDEKTAIVDAEAAKLLEDGCVAVFYPGNDNSEGMSMWVSSLSQYGEGNAYQVSGSEVQLDDVVESINVNGEAAETLSYEIADGISVEDGSEVAVAFDGDSYGDEYGVAARASFDGEKPVGQLKLDVFDGATVTVNPSVIYSFKYEHGQLSKCKLAIKNEYKAAFEWSAKKDFKTKLLTATYATSVPGLTVTVDLYLVGSASGEVNVEATVTGTSGIDYSDSGLKMISDADFSYEASFEALLKAGVKPTAIMKFVGLGLADVDAEVGASISGSLNQRSTSFVCADMSAWMYVDVNAGAQKTALGKIMDLLKLKKEYHPLDKSNSPQWNIHCENGELVDKCTWGQDAEESSVYVARQTISAGTSSAAIIKNDGSLWAMGDNYFGQLGNGDDSLEKSDEFIKIMDDVRSVDDCTAIKKDGSLWAWSGVRGFGSRDGRVSVPVKIDDGVANAAVGVYVKEDGTLWKFGYWYFEDFGGSKKLGDGVRAAKSTSNEIVFLKDDGSVWQMRRENDSIDDAQKITDDVQRICRIASDKALVVKEDGSLYTWSTTEGASSLKKEGPANVVDAQSYPEGDSKVSDPYSNLALTKNGSVMVWGSNHAGALGTGDEVDVSSPMEIISGISQISQSWGLGMALKSDGSVYAWGPGWYGDVESFRGYVVCSKTPVKIADGVLVP